MKRFSFILIALIFTLSTLSLPLASAQSDAEIEYRTNVQQANIGDEVSVDIVLKNPSQKPVISARTWLSYDPNALEGVSIDTANSPFTLAAPGEDAFSQGEGRVKIGRSNISGGVTDLESVVATVRFQVKTVNAMNTAISAYDYQVSELGHTSVNIIEDGFPLNILSGEPEKREIALNGGSAGVTPTVTPPTPTTPEPTPIIGGPVVSLARPTNVKIATGSGYVDVTWETPTDPQITGYNVYYGQQSGLYSRRRTAGNVNQFRIDGLLNGQAYYVAVTAYNQFNQESDYSDEVAIIVNEPLSSTSPFDEILGRFLARVPEQPQNGPLAGMLAFTAAGLAGSFALKRKKLS